LCLNGQNEACHDRSVATRTISLPLPPVEVSLPEQSLPEAGSSTSQPRVIDESYQAKNLSLTLEGVAGTTVDLFLRRNTLNPSNKRTVDVEVNGAQKVGDKLRVTFPAGSGFVSQQLQISWQK